MDRTRYERYVGLVNTKQMAAAAADYYDEEMDTIENQKLYKGKQGTLDLMAFTHTQMNETIELLGFYPGEDENSFGAEAMLKYEALKDLKVEDFEKAGYKEMFMPLKKGEITKVHCFFRYKLRNGKYHHIQVFSA